MKKENYFSRIILVLMAIALIIAINGLANQKPIVTMTPPHLNEAATLHYSQASESMHKAWSKYIAETVGNITPVDAEFARNTVEVILSPSVRDQVLMAMDQQVDQIRRDRVSFSFETREVTFHPSTQKTYVTGRHTTHVSPTNQDTVIRTYEFEWQFTNYMPQLTFIDTYQGSPNIQQEIN